MSDNVLTLNKAMGKLVDINTHVRAARRAPVIHGYDRMDVDWAMKGIDLATKAYLSAVKAYLENNENIAGMVEFDDFAGSVRDTVADELTGPLQRQLNEMEGN